MSDSRDGPPADERAPVSLTARALALGTLASAACFVVGFALAVLGAPEETLDPLRPADALRSLVALQPSGWSTLGVWLVLLTPVGGLVASFIEMRDREPRAAWAALAVLGVLAAATVVAVVVG